MNKKVKLSSIPKEIAHHATVNDKNEIMVDHIPHVLSATTILRNVKNKTPSKKQSLKN